MKKVLVALGALVGVLGGALMALLAMIPADQINGRLVSGAKAATGRDLAIRGKITVTVLPSLSGKVEVASFVLVAPVITLETDRQGRGNWVFDTASAAKPETKPTAPATAATAPGDLAQSDVRISNARLIQIDGETGARQEASDINLQLALAITSVPIPLGFGGRATGGA